MVRLLLCLLSSCKCENENDDDNDDHSEDDDVDDDDDDNDNCQLLHILIHEAQIMQKTLTPVVFLFRAIFL